MMKTFNRIIALVVLALPAQLAFAAAGQDFVELYGGYTGGGFKSSSQPLKAWNAGFRSKVGGAGRLFTYSGKLSFDQFRGEGMAGSMFIRPAMYPVDFIQNSTAVKTRSTLDFSGIVKYSIPDDGSYALLAVDATGATYHRQGGFRHDNERCVIGLAPEYAFSTGTSSHVAVSYIFRRESERIVTTLDGGFDGDHEVFTDEGLLYGPNLNWADSENLCVEYTNGLALGILSSKFEAKAIYKYSSGRLGEGDDVKYRFPGHDLTLLARHHFEKSSAEIVAKLSSKSNSDVTGAEPFRLYDRRAASLIPAFNGKWGSWKAGTSLNLSYAGESSTPVGPSEYGQETWTFLLGANASKSWKLVTFALDCAYGDGKYIFTATPTDSYPGTVEPYKLEKYWLGMMDYITSCHVCVNPSLSLRFREGGHTYIRLDGHFTKAFKLEIIKKSTRYDAFLTIGYRL